MEKTRKEKYKDYRLEIERLNLSPKEDTISLPQIEEENSRAPKTTLLVSVDDILKGTQKEEDEEEKCKKVLNRNKKDIVRNIIFFILLITLIVLSIITGVKAFS